MMIETTHMYFGSRTEADICFIIQFLFNGLDDYAWQIFHVISFLVKSLGYKWNSKKIKWIYQYTC